MIHDDLKNELKDAMRAKDELRLRTIRGLLTAFTNELVATKRKPDEVLDDEDALKVITRQAKQRKDSIEQFEKGGRDDLAQNEKDELKILEGYLPELMSEDEVRKIVEAKKAELGIDDKNKIGQLMGVVMAELKGKADGGVVKNVVDSLF